MPKRRALPSFPDYTGNVKNPAKLLIQKSNPLQSLSQTSMTLPELKILDAYLARIDSHEPDKRYVRFEKGELERILGVTRMHHKDLSKRVKNLFQAVEVCDESKPNGFICISLFSKAECWQDGDGLWQINLACSEEAMEYIFNIENRGYLKYRLRNVINLTSRYSYILYLCLEDNIKTGNHKKWIVDIDDLKKVLNCTAVSYSGYKEFNDKILKKCQREINKKTTISFAYVPIKRGRKVIAIEFEIDRQSQRIEAISKESESQIVPEIISSSVNSEQNSASSEHEKMVGRYSLVEFLSEACEDEFNEEQMKEICDIVSKLNFTYQPLGIAIAQYDYLWDLYRKLKKYTDGKEMNNKRLFAYFKKMIENDIYKK